MLRRYDLPDPSNEQYPVMCAAIRAIAREKFQAGEKGGGDEMSTRQIDDLLEDILIWVECASTQRVLTSKFNSSRSSAELPLSGRCCVLLALSHTCCC